MWHHAQFRNEELLVLGHNPTRNDCMLVKLSGLPMAEQQELRRIAASRVAQESVRLIPILQRMDSPHPGLDWFSYLARKMEQRNSPVITLPIKEIQETLDPDQKAIFKGYGKGRINTRLEADARAQEFGGDVTARPDDTSTVLPPINTRDTIVGQGGDVGYKIDLMMETLVDENRRTQQLLNKLIGALSGEPEEIEVVKAVPKPARKRPSVKKTTKQEVHVQ